MPSPAQSVPAGKLARSARSDEIVARHRKYLWPQVMERARQNGLLIRKGGLYGNVLRLAPMLNTSKSDVDEATRLLDKSFSEVRS